CLSLFFNDPATTDTSTLSLHDALPICPALRLVGQSEVGAMAGMMGLMTMTVGLAAAAGNAGDRTRAEVTELGDLADQLGALVLQDRKSTRLNSSHVSISYAVFCLKKKK